MSSSPGGGDPEVPPSKHDSPKSHPTNQNPTSLQATEQQLKARAEGVSIEDYLLPRSQTIRLAKSVLPPNTSIQKDAVLAIQKAATVFVSYLSSHANESTLKRTVTPADVFAALSELELEGFRPRLEKELAVFEAGKAAKRRPRVSKGGGENGDKGADVDADVDKGEGKIGEGEKKEVVVRGVKRVKRGEGEIGGGGDGDEEEEEDVVDEVDEVDAEEHDEIATEEEDEEEDDDDNDEEASEDDDIDRVEDLDRGSRRRMVDPDAAGDDTESDDEGPGSQLRGDLGLG
ncbi:histone-fold-containing protein [Aspergillus spectabilis]